MGTRAQTTDGCLGFWLGPQHWPPTLHASSPALPPRPWRLFPLLQMTAGPEEASSLDQYLRTSFLTTASLVANSCEAVALLGGQGGGQAAAAAAGDYGR